MNIFDSSSYASSVRIASSLVYSIECKSFSIIWERYISNKLPKHTIQACKQICNVLSGLSNITHDVLAKGEEKSSEPLACKLCHKVSIYRIKLLPTPKNINNQSITFASKLIDMEKVIRPSSRLQSVLYDVDDGRAERVDVDKAIREQVSNRERLMKEVVYKLLGEEKADSIGWR